MGAHHYHLEMLPRKSVGVDPEVDDVWNEQPPDTLLAELRTMLPNGKTWGDVEEFEAEGDWGSDLRIWHEDGIDSPVYSIVLRYAPVTGAHGLLESFLALAAKYDVLLYSRANKRSFEPKWDELFSDMKTTPAFKFVSDPEDAIVRAAANIRSTSDC